MGTVDRELLTVRDVAAATCLSTRSIWKLLASGRMPAAVRIGRSVRWRAAEIRAWIDAGCPSRDRWDAIREGERCHA